MNATVDESCVICGARMHQAFRARVLNRHEVTYFYCGSCQHLRTEKPYWLELASAAG